LSCSQSKVDSKISYLLARS